MSQERPEQSPSPSPMPTGRRLLRAHASVWRAWLKESGSLRVFLFYMPGPGPMLMSWLRKRWVMFRNPHCRIEFHGPVYLGPRFSLDAPRGGTFLVGPAVEFRRGFRGELAGPDALIQIGAASVLTYDVLIQCSSSIVIGEHCLLGQASMIVDGNHRFRDIETPMLDQGYDLRPIHIDDHVWVTNKCTIVANIGRQTVVGANSVVTRDLPPFCVAVGAPAKVVDYFGPAGGEPAGVGGLTHSGQ